MRISWQITRRRGAVEMVLSFESFCEIGGQCRANVPIGPQGNIIHVLAAAAALDLVQESVELFEIAFTQGARVGEQVRQLFQSAEKRRVLKREFKFRGIQYVEDNDL